MNFKLGLSFLLFIIFSYTSKAQDKKSHKFDLQVSDFKSKLKNAPKSTNFESFEILANKNPNLIYLPLPDGTMKSFHVIGSEVMGEQLKAKFPDINTFRIFGTNKKDNLSGTLTISESGLHAIIFSPEGEILINPDNAFSSQYNSSFQSLSTIAEACGLGPEHLKVHKPKNKGKVTSVFASNGSTIKTYRIAIVTTGEFYLNNGATIASAQTAVVSIVNALKAVYEKELSISFNLVSAHIFTDPNTDPFIGSDATAAANAFGALASSNPTGFAVGNYDIGQVLQHSPGGGGVAYIGAVCNNYNVGNPVSPIKAGGFSGVTTSFIGTLVHEVGHQFGAGHAFNSISGGCSGGNLSSESAVEPGSGSTYMSYFSSCSPDNLSSGFGRAYFNSYSLEEIIYFVNNYTNCFTSAANTNTPPVINQPVNQIIPKGTPFKLSGTGSDANANTLTYNWEQIDIASVSTAVRGGADDAQNSLYSPIFRSYEPSATGNTRFFPNLNQILNIGNAPNNDEALPQVPRLLNMRLLARDNVAGGGGIDYKDMIVTVDNAGPFLITSQNQPNVWFVNDTKSITWSVNGTNLAPLNVANVNILLSTDGGNTFPTVLASNTPNDGSHVITVPNNLSSQVRIKIEPNNANQIFFDINNANISIVNTFTCAAEASTISPSSAISALAGASTLNLNMAGGKPLTSFTITTTTTDQTMRLTGLTSGACSFPFSNSPYYKKMNFTVNTSGTYSFGNNNSNNAVSIYKNTFNKDAPCSNWVASSMVFTNPITNPTLSTPLSADTSYIIVFQPGFGTNSMGTATISPTGAGSFLQTLPIETSFYAYTFVITNSANTVVGIQNQVNLSNSSLFPSDVYTIRGLSYLAGVDLNSYVGQAFSVLQNSFTSTPNCGILSSNSRTVTVNCPSTPSPTASNVTICSVGSATLAASGCTGGIYNWYTAATGGTSLANTASFVTPSLSTSTSYFVSCTVGGCPSSRIQVNVSVNITTAPSFNGIGILSGNTAILNATGCSGGTINWYDVNTGGTSLGTGTSYTTAVLSYPIETKTYYASCTIGTCVSPNRSSGIVTVCNTGSLTLSSPINNISTAGITQHKTNGIISATNKINPVNGTNVDFNSGKAIHLNPGFEVNSTSGASFKAIIQGCI